MTGLESGQAAEYVNHFGKGYATEALRALLPVVFEFMPRAGGDGTGFDYIEAGIDPENQASRRVLEKCGFTFYRVTKQDFNHPTKGLRDSAWYRIARPGTTLELSHVQHNT
ncbi:hypothetical protein LTR62_006412 [Meristemomyces frigidus]|uniref:N-acetyltransferase domain-containing protein n=1 Tax=Meristemomyces frigidus TaxID=1508187 RepID=A0AAN7YEI0_9PEZI|nr:hypothetical protein LTR62_006412 [Meristemomyces frigidus]